VRAAGARDGLRAPGAGLRERRGAGRAPWAVARVALTVLAIGAGSAGAQVSVRAEVNAKRVGLDDQVQYSIVIEGRTGELQEDPKLPLLNNLRLVGGPSTSTQVSIVNGAMSQARSFTFLLQPLVVGDALIGPAHVLLSSGERVVPEIPITVVTGSILPPAARPGDPFADFFGNDPFEQMMARRRAQPTGKVFVEAEASRKTVYVGEPLLLTYYLYTQTRIAGLDFEDAPKYQGFWAEDLPRKEDQLKSETVTRDGEVYQRVAVFRRLLYPTKAGTLPIPAARFRLSVPVQIGFFTDTTAPQTLARSTNDLLITVKPLPTDPMFTGAVGSFRVSSTIDHDNLAIGDAATLRLRVEGRGNLKWVETAPALAVPGAKVYPPQVKSDLAAAETGISGSRTWEYVIVPQTSGRLTIPAQRFTYFDPSAERLVQAQTAPLTLDVRPAAAAAAVAAGGAPAIAPPQPGGVHLRSDLDLPTALAPRLGRTPLLAFVLLALGLHAALLGSRLIRGRSRSGPAVAPHRTIRQALADLRRAGREGMSKEAAALLIERTLTDVFGEVDERGNGGGERETAVRDLLHEVRFIRYAPQLGDYSEKIREVADRAADVVRRWA
jgi:hypothetical protein